MNTEEKTEDKTFHLRVKFEELEKHVELLHGQIDGIHDALRSIGKRLDGQDTVTTNRVEKNIDKLIKQLQAAMEKLMELLDVTIKSQVNGP